MIVKKIFLVVSLLPSTGALGHHHSLFSREALGLKDNTDPDPEINECSASADCPTGFFCDTTDTTGNTCENVDECAGAANVCDVNADCTDTIGSFICICKTGYTGDGLTCTPIPSCLSTPCKNGATCQDLLNGGYICTCTQYWMGDTCQDDINECGVLGGGANLNCLGKDGRLCHNLIGDPGYECCRLGLQDCVSK